MCLARSDKHHIVDFEKSFADWSFVENDKFVYIHLVDDEEVHFRFTEGEECHKLPWPELLSADDEAPFESLESIHVGMSVLAPWLDGDGSIQHSEATVVSDDDYKNG